MGNDTAGGRLKEIRLRLGLTLRDVEELSARMAAGESDDNLHLSHARIAQIENDESVPGIHKLLTLSAAYGIPIHELLGLYVNLQAVDRYHVSALHRHTRPLHSDLQNDDTLTVELPASLHATASLEQTSLLAELVKIWGHVPLGFLKNLNLRKSLYAVIGLTDYTMHPLLRPGSIVQIDREQKIGRNKAHASEFERPLYFIEARSRYICCWCELRERTLVAIPHPLSPCRTEAFSYPNEADVVGRVVAVAARLDDSSSAAQIPRDTKENHDSDRRALTTASPFGAISAPSPARV